MVKGCEGYNCEKLSIDDCNYCNKHFCARHLPQAFTTSQAPINELAKDSQAYWELLSEWNRPLSHPCPNYTTWRREKYDKDRKELAIFNERIKARAALAEEIASKAKAESRPRVQTNIIHSEGQIQNPYLHNNTTENTGKDVDELVESLHKKWRNHQRQVWIRF